MSDLLYPPLEPFKTHHLKVSQIHTIYFEESGNPNGIPVLFLHGGPGGGTEPSHRQLYDPAKHRIILVDQRGSGQSTPFAEILDNTTWDLVADLERVREHLQIPNWCIHGGSWGTTLALVYAISHPTRVRALVLRGIFLCTRKEIQWFYQDGVDWLYPDEWTKYISFIPKEERHDMIGAYYKRLTSENAELRLKAAQTWSMWEASVSKLIPSESFIKKYEDPQKALPFARIEAHYFKNNAFLPSDNFILANTDKLTHIPVDIVHGRYDVVCPVKNAWQLHNVLPKSRLFIVPDAGHSLFEEPILKQVVKSAKEIFV